MNIDDSVLLTNLLRGLHPDLGQSAANLSLLTPTYAKAVTYLRMEEKRLRHAARQAPLAALHASTTKGIPALPQPPRAAAPPPPAAPDQGRQKRRGGRDGRGRNGGSQPRQAPPPAPA